jgi:hypothetical protein
MQPQALEISRFSVRQKVATMQDCGFSTYGASPTKYLWAATELALARFAHAR